MRRPPFSVLGAAGTAVGCTAMAATLPAGIANVLASIGVGGSSVLARTLGSTARPLFIASSALLVLGALACSRLVTVLATSGAILLYLSMFELSAGPGGAMNMGGMAGVHAARADAPTFYAGLTVILVSLAVQLIRRRRGTCRAVLRLRRGC